MLCREDTEVFKEECFVGVAAYDLLLGQVFVADRLVSKIYLQNTHNLSARVAQACGVSPLDAFLHHGPHMNGTSFYLQSTIMTLVLSKICAPYTAQFILPGELCPDNPCFLAQIQHVNLLQVNYKSWQEGKSLFRCEHIVYGSSRSCGNRYTI